MSEKSTYNSFRKGIIMPGDRIDRVENLCVKGMFDLNCCLSGKEFWIEMKYATEPVKFSTRLLGNKGLSQDQKNWAKMQVDAGGLAYILISTNRRRIIMRAELADEVNDMAVPDLLRRSIFHKFMPYTKDDWSLMRKKMIEAEKE